MSVSLDVWVMKVDALSQTFKSYLDCNKKYRVEEQFSNILSSQRNLKKSSDMIKSVFCPWGRPKVFFFVHR